MIIVLLQSKTKFKLVLNLNDLATNNEIPHDVWLFKKKNHNVPQKLIKLHLC